MKARDRQFSRKLMSLAVPCALAAAIAAPPNTLAQDADTDDIKALT